MTTQRAIDNPAPDQDRQGVLRVWDNPLGDVLHAKVNRIVGPPALQLEFDCDDASFAAAITSRWPQHDDPTDNVIFDHVGLMRLVDNLNQLARLYAIETGRTHIRVIVEARRGLVRLPSWWADAVCMYATFGLTTQAASVCLTDDPAAAFEAIPLMDKYNRLLVAFGPGTPDYMRDAEDPWSDADEKQLQSLKRWEQQLSQQLARLLTYTFGGSMMEEETIVDALATMRGCAGKVRSGIYDAVKRRSQSGKNEAEQTLADAVQEIKAAIKSSAENATMPAPARVALRHSLDALQKIERRTGEAYIELKERPRIRKIRIVRKPRRTRKRRMKAAIKRLNDLRFSLRRPGDEPDAPQYQPVIG